MTWRDILETAAAVDAEARRHLPPLLALLEKALRGADTADDARAALGSDSLTSPFLERLDAVIRSDRERWSRATLEAVRGTLMIVKSVLFTLRPDSANRSGKAPRVAAKLAALEKRLQDIPPEPEGGLPCPRCGSRRTETRRTKATARPYRELGCTACGYFEDSFD